MTRQNLRTEKVVSKSATILLLLLSAALILNSEALSAEPSLQQGTVEYANKNYSKALEIFKESVARNPSNAVAHYYLGLCHIQLHNRPAARSEFREAIKYGDYKVTPLAVKALEKMGETVSLPRVPLKVKKILEFYADWCGPCKVFGPVFEASKAKFPEISFERFNVDDAKNSALTGQYRISRIPCVVFLDAAGKTLYNGLPKGVASEWEESIRQFH